MNHRYYCQLSALPGNDALVCQRRTTKQGRTKSGRILGREAVRCRLVCGTCRLIDILPRLVLQTPFAVMRWSTSRGQRRSGW
jgi:hypothetical protein